MTSSARPARAARSTGVDRWQGTRHRRARPALHSSTCTRGQACRASRCPRAGISFPEPGAAPRSPADTATTTQPSGPLVSTSSDSARENATLRGRRAPEDQPQRRVRSRPPMAGHRWRDGTPLHRDRQNAASPQDGTRQAPRPRLPGRDHVASGPETSPLAALISRVFGCPSCSQRRVGAALWARYLERVHAIAGSVR